MPHCNGMGTVYPNAHAGMRGVKAEGGWGVVCTEQCDFHPHWRRRPMHRGPSVGRGTSRTRVVEEVHGHGASPASSWSTTADTPNLYSREVPIGPMHRPVNGPGAGPGAGMDRRTSPHLRRCATGRRRTARAHPASTSSSSMPATTARRPATSSRAAPTSGPTSTAAAWRTGCACSASCSRRRRRRSGRRIAVACASPSTR